MPDPLPGLLSALRDAVPDLDGTALAEALWLAAHMAEEQAAAGDRPAPQPSASASAGGAADRPERPDTPSRAKEPEAARATPGPATGPTGPGATTPSARPLHERLPGSGNRVRGHAVAAPRAPGLPRALELTRALRPWKRRWPRGRRAELDIEATVDGYARSGELIPVLSAAPERWFDLALVVDRSPGMRVWRETIAEFTGVLDRLGAFRTLQVHDLTFDGAGEPRVPGQLRSADGRRLVVVVSDCMADAWRRPEVWHLLRDWAGAHPTAVLNPLPTKLWRRGGLNLPTARFSPAAPGTHRSRVPVEPPPLLDPMGPDEDGDWLPVPVLSLTPHSLARWSHTLMRGAPEGCTAVLVPPTGRTTSPNRPPATPLPPAALARNLLRTASPRAARLAVLCSPFDRLSLRLLHLVREQLVPEATVADVAEVVTSGVFRLEEHGTGGAVELLLPPDAQAVLREHLPAHELWAVHQELDRYVATHGAGPARLPSVAHDGQGPHDLAAEKEAFARASRRTLELLGFAEPEEEPGPVDAEGEPGLPPAPEPFVGHGETVEELVRDLTAGMARLVCLTAPGGVPGAGRTALALHVAHRVREHFPDGVLYVPLRGSTRDPVPPEAALCGVLRDLGAADTGTTDEGRTADVLQHELRRTLAGRRVLLVLDDLGTPEQIRILGTEPPEGCAVLLTAREQPYGLRGSGRVELPPLAGADAVRLLAASTGPDPEGRFDHAVVGSGRWWPLTLRVLGGALASPDATAFLPDRLPTRSRTGQPPMDPRALLRHRLAHLSGGLDTDLVRLAVATAGECTLQEAMAVLDRDATEAAARLDVLVRAGLLERSGQERYAFQAAVHAEVESLSGFDSRRTVARERIARFRRAAAAALCEERSPGTALPVLLGAEATPAPQPEVWIPNALVPSGRGAGGMTADTLLLLHHTATSPLYRARFGQAARSLIDGRALYADTAWIRAVVALAHAQEASGRPDGAWDTLRQASSSQLQSDPATRGLTASLLARLTFTRQSRQSGGARAALSWAEEALRHLDVGATALSPETGDALRLLEQALAASDAPDQLLAAQRRLRAHLRHRGLHAEEGRVLIRLAETLLLLDLPADAESAARRAVSIIDGVGDERGRHEASRVLATAQAAQAPQPAEPQGLPGRRTIIAVESSAQAERLTAAAKALLAVSALLRPDGWQIRALEDCLLLLVDPAVPVDRLLEELVDGLPVRLDAAGEHTTLRLAVHSGPVRVGREDPSPGLGVEYTRTMLRSAEFRRVSENYPRAATLCVSPEVYEGLPDALNQRYTAREVRSQDGAEVCVILTPRVDLSAFDTQLLALARVFNELDPDGRRMARILRDCLDAALDARTTGRFDLAYLRLEEHARLPHALGSALRGSFPFEAGRATDLVWQRPQGAVPFDLTFTVQGPRWRFAWRPPGAVHLFVYADDASACWSAGLIRLRPELLAPGTSRHGSATLTAEARRTAVLWLHRDAPLPENVLLRLDPATRDTVLSRPDDVTRVCELFRQVRLRPVPASALRPLIRAQDPDRTVRLAAVALREDGLLLLTGNARGRDAAETLRLPVPEPGEYLCAPLVRRRSDHGARPSIVADGAAWVLAREDDEPAPLPEGFPGLRRSR
ncbi:NaeI family type II restriction endonuclease [Streptomyces sp. NPDC085481]|uniref:NaeI family type II restriction endonuclease n=1 Tax=Streptomyces sp. NPDC085481 TaxID=3365727 RepID=UPI0037D21C3D